jgi:protein-disulfide isomerase
MINTRLVVLLAGALLAVGCKKPSSGPGSTGPASAARDPNAAVAKLGAQTITEAELQTAAKKELMRADAEHAEKVHQIKEQALNGLVDKKLIEAKAKSENITSEALIEREVTAKVPNPSDDEVKQIYDRTKASGRELPPYDQVKGDIVKFVKERNSEQARRTFVDKLRSDAKVSILLPPVLLPKVEVAAVGASKGPDNAPVTIVEFSDYECPFCSRAEETVKKVMEEYKGKVRVVFRDYPLPFHQNAQKAHEAAQCAGEQKKYWEMHEKLFANQKALGVPQLKEYAKGLGLDAGKFDKCLDSGEKAKVVEAAKKAGDEVGVNGTPAFFINGRPLSGAVPFEKFKEIIDLELRGS